MLWCFGVLVFSRFNALVPYLVVPRLSEVSFTPRVPRQGCRAGRGNLWKCLLCTKGKPGEIIGQASIRGTADIRGGGGKREGANCRQLGAALQAD